MHLSCQNSGNRQQNNAKSKCHSSWYICEMPRVCVKWFNCDKGLVCVFSKVSHIAMAPSSPNGICGIPFCSSKFSTQLQSIDVCPKHCWLLEGPPCDCMETADNPKTAVAGFLDRIALVTLADGRQLAGTFVCIDSFGNILLRNTEVWKEMKDGDVETPHEFSLRSMGIVSIAKKHVAAARIEQT